MTALLSGFEYQRVEVEGVTVNCATAGSGPTVLLLHGYPQNHLMWRDVAPALAEDHTVVLADLRGYGDSGKPDPDAAGDAYSKRSMARDQLGLMRELGFAQFQLVGHDRGARVSHRLTLVGLALLALAVLGCVYLACWAAVGAGPAALWTAVAAVALGLNWVALPLFIRMRSGPEDEHGSGAPSVTR